MFRRECNLKTLAARADGECFFFLSRYENNCWLLWLISIVSRNLSKIPVSGNSSIIYIYVLARTNVSKNDDCVGRWYQLQ